VTREWVELAATSNFTFLHGASHAEELVERSAELGYRAVAITDRNSLAGIVRAHVAAKEAGIPLLVGAKLEITAAEEGPPIVLHALATSLAGYGRLCTLLTLGKRRAPKGQCLLRDADLPSHAGGLQWLIQPSRAMSEAATSERVGEVLASLRHGADPDAISLVLAPRGDGRDRARLASLGAIADELDLPSVAVGDAIMHAPQRRALQDVLTCIRHGCSLSSAGRRLEPTGGRFLRSPAELHAIFAGHRRAIDRARQIAERAMCFSLDEIRYEYPREVCPEGRTEMEHLRALTAEGERQRYPRGVPEKVRRQIDHEMALIGELRYAPYFLTVHDIVVFARARGILCQGRGAAANSAVCYCLGITAVDPDRFDLLFERFVSRERNEPPDIDIDFEHERREEVIQYLYAKYGRDRAALTAEVISYRGRSAIRDVGKALGLSLDLVDRLAKNLEWWQDGIGRAAIMRDLGLDPSQRVFQALRMLAEAIIGFPRHLSQHVGGFVITRRALSEIVPIENAAMPGRTVIEWDKDDIDAMGMLKVDILGLGMLTCIRKAMSMINAQRGLCDETFEREARERPAGEKRRRTTPSAPPLAIEGLSPDEPLELHNVPAEDPHVYAMIQAADTVGVFQIESRAQMSMLPRLRPACFYDLVIEVAIVRPGPIQGDMVHPYLRRRRGEEPVTYPDEAVRKVLAKTLGVPLFQEQAMALAIVAAGFTAGEADQLRRAMAAWKRKGKEIVRFREKFLAGMAQRGYEAAYAERCFRQIEGFSEYGFPESHAASFALLVYVSAWLKLHHPAIFAAALLNSLPMGFYAPAQIVRDAQDHGVEVEAVDVSTSRWECSGVSMTGSAIRPIGATRSTLGMAPSIERVVPRGVSRPRREGPREGPVVKKSPEEEMTLLTASSEPPGANHAAPVRTGVLRLGARLVRGLVEEETRAVLDTARGMAGGESKEPHSLETLWRRSGARLAALRRLARADAMRSFGLDRRHALWELQRLREWEIPMFADVPDPAASAAPHAPLPVPPPLREVVADYGAIGLSLRAHPISFVREELTAGGVLSASELLCPHRCPTGRRASVGGLVLVRQRPSTANGIVFMTLEDETGIANLVIRPRVYQRERRLARHGIALIAQGRIERDGDVVHLIVRRFASMEGMLNAQAETAFTSRDFH